jgi:hypothetical protein
MQSESPILPIRAAVDYDPDADRQEDCCERKDMAESVVSDHTTNEHCAATSHLSHKDQCSDNLNKEKAILSTVDYCRDCQKDDIRLLVSLVAQHSKALTLASLPPRRITIRVFSLKAAQQSC